MNQYNDRYRRVLALAMVVALSACGGEGEGPAAVDDGTAEPLSALEVDALIASQQAKLLAPDGQGSDNYGFSMAISGDTLLVGARLATGKVQRSGAVYVYVKGATGEWTQQAKLAASDGAQSDSFGLAVAISGNTAIVGARDDDDKGTNSGSAYAFVRNGSVWTQQAKFVPNDGAAADWFGQSVAISGDVTIVGAPMDDDKGVNSGSAYVFYRGQPTTWSQRSKLTMTDGAAEDAFGYAVSASDHYLFVGAPMDDDLGAYSGTVMAYHYDASTYTWDFSTPQKLLASGSVCWFGASLASSGNTLLVGARTEKVGAVMTAGAAYTFVENGGIFTKEAKLLPNDPASSDYFGYSVSIDGPTAIVGAYFDDDRGANSGSAYVFERSGGTWSQNAKLLAGDGAAGDYFGQSVALSANSAFVGAPMDDDKGSNSGSAYLFTLE